MKLAFICDWLTGMRGGERCLEAMCEVSDSVDIYTLVHFQGTVSEKIESNNIHTSYIQKLPGDKETFRRYLPLFPHAIGRFEFTQYDCVLSFSHCVAKNVRVPPDVPHICYCFTPMRYAWVMRQQYLNGMSQPKRFLAHCLLNYLQGVDKKTANGVSNFIAISKNIQDRIKHIYNRDSSVIYPPVDCSRFSVSQKDDGYYLILSALVPYKRVDIAIDAFKTGNRRLLVVGNGPELKRLKMQAGANVDFVKYADDRAVADFLKNCTALLFPGEEDFGIVPLEAQACGKPVIAFGRGGALETIAGWNRRDKNNSTGIFFSEQNPSELLKAVKLFESNRDAFSPAACRQNAMKFDKPIYQKLMKDYLSGVAAKGRP